MAIATSACAQQKATAVFAFLDSARIEGVRLADECYLPLDRMGEIGWTFTVQKGFADIRAEDKLIRAPLRQVRGETMIPLSVAANALGAVSEWDKDTLRVFSVASSIRSKPGDFEARVTIPVRARLRAGEDAQTSFELIGARLSPTCKLDLGEGATAENTPDGIRVRLDDTQALKSETIADDRAGVFRLEFQPVAGEVGTTIEPIGTDATVLTAPQIQAPTAKAGPLLLDLESDLAAVLLLPVKGKIKGSAAFRRPEPNVVEILLPGTEIEVGPPITSASIQSVEVRQEGGVGVVSLRLARPMGIELSSTAGQIAIQLLKPKVGDGHLAGKIVVVDAGHGGQDGGASPKDKSAFEKNLTLKVAKLASESLARQGATVILTRKSDVFIPLKERPEIANRNRADFFVSIHINSNGVANSTSGSIAFYHKSNPIGQLLADCIHREIAKVSGLPAIGVWSDSRIYKSGFAVLRGAKMPAVLLELGFINHKRDRVQMGTAAYQAAIAEAISRGIRSFLGDNER